MRLLSPPGFLSCRGLLSLVAASTLVMMPALAAPPVKPTPTTVPGTKTTAGAGGGVLPGSNAREPVTISAEKLDYFSKEHKAVYSGNVVARQGEAVLKAQKLVIVLNAPDDKAPEDKNPSPSLGTGKGAGKIPGKTTPSISLPSTSSNDIKRLEADGDVSIVQADQTGSGDHASYDKAENKVYMTGNVSLVQGDNVAMGERLVYDMVTGQARIVGRVSSLFTPGSDASVPGAGDGKTGKKSAKDKGAH